MSILHLEPGFEFIPTDTELLQFLKDKILGHLDQLTSGFIPDHINPYGYDPIRLPKGNHFNRTNQAYFFTHKNQNRTLKNGFWRKASTLPEEINSAGKILGLKEQFDFFWLIGNETVETSWTMREYNVNPAIFSDDEREAIGNEMESCIVCAIQYKKVSFFSCGEESDAAADMEEEIEAGMTHPKQLRRSKRIQERLASHPPQR
ncbi:NAC domain-containing protein 1-like [Telopea speciosissima]|uniref:NAC domain-containing protein 1-like n=1 Tax=Telopea speciosissima TaxID=54955 RepID=UPI001CC5F73C|nr:NAC domain-containing protein 1-like [Telopea speciosissima]